MNLNTQVALLYQVEAPTVTRVGGELETEEGVTVPEVDVSRSSRPATPYR